MKAYSMDLRERVLADCDQGMGTYAVSLKHRVSTAWIRRLKQRRRQSGEVGPKKQRHGVLAASVVYEKQILEAVRQTPDATLAELLAKLQLPLSKASLLRALLALGLTRKKRPSRPASKTGPT